MKIYLLVFELHHFQLAVKFHHKIIKLAQLPHALVPSSQNT